MTRILIAEDNVMIGMMITADLQRAGYDVDGPFLRNAPALAAAAAAAPDLALLDIDLQGGDSGIDLALTLREQHGVAALFVTGQSEQAETARATALGVLVKPFRSDALLRAVEAGLRYAREGRRPDEGVGYRWF